MSEQQTADAEQQVAGAAVATEVAAVDDVEEALRDVVDPELGINVVDLGRSTASRSTRPTSPSST